MSTVRPYSGPGAYPVRVYVGVNPRTGKRRRRSETIHPKTEKDYWRDLKRVERKLMRERGDEEAERGTVAELVADWLALAERDRSPSTMRKSYRPRAKLIVERFGAMAAVDLRERDIDGWYTSLMTVPRIVRRPKKKPPVMATMTASGILELHRVFSAILQFGVMKRRLSFAVTELVTLPEHVQPDIPLPDDAVMARVWEELPRVPWGDAVRLLAATGLRRGEVVGLRWEDWKGRTIRVRHSITELEGGGVHIGAPKGKRNRTVTLGRMGCDVLEAQRARDLPGPWVFGDGRGDPARPGWISLMWGRWRTAHGAGGIGLHGLRHWYATVAISSGASPADLSKQLGHAKVSTTMDIYVAETDAGREFVADAVDRALAR